MTKKTQWIGVGFLAVVALAGCKTPQMAWWKSGDSADSTAVARTAPVSPAEAAKQAEQLAANSSQLVGAAATPAQFAASPTSLNVNAAPAFNPSAPAAYPKTAAPAYTPAQVAAAAPAASGIYNTGTMPYDPASPPAGAVAQAQPTVEPSSRYNVAGATPAGQDRYPSISSPSPSVAATSVAPPTPAAQPAAPRYPSTDITPYPSTQAPASQVAGASAANANRYAPAPQSSNLETGVEAELAATATSVPYPPTGAAALYRPAGTSSYPGSVEVATRPSSTATSTTQSASPSVESTTPVDATPADSGRYR